MLPSSSRLRKPTITNTGYGRLGACFINSIEIDHACALHGDVFIRAIIASPSSSSTKPVWAGRSLVPANKTKLRNASPLVSYSVASQPPLATVTKHKGTVRKKKAQRPSVGLQLDSSFPLGSPITLSIWTESDFDMVACAYVMPASARRCYLNSTTLWVGSISLLLAMLDDRCGTCH